MPSKWLVPCPGSGGGGACHFPDDIDGDINECGFGYCMTKWGDIWKISLTQWNRTFKICSRMLQRSIQTARGQRIFSVTEFVKFTDVVYCNWSLRNYSLLSFGVVSKQNIHSYVKILKYSSLFQFQIFTKLDFLDILQPNMLQNKQCRICENLAVFY